METQRSTVVITGVSGYVGSQVCLSFLKDGGFKVRGTVRDPHNEAKIAPLRKAFGDLFSQLELVPADLMDPESIDKAVEGCEYVVHVASPLPGKPPKDENTVIKPAVEGTLSVMKAALKHKVKRVVYTSTELTVMMKAPKNRKEKYSEEDWSDLEVLGTYEKSKFLAEKAAWDFVNSLPDGEKFELTTILPAFVQGPPLVTSDFSSGAIMKMLMLG